MNEDGRGVGGGVLAVFLVVLEGLEAAVGPLPSILPLDVLMVGRVRLRSFDVREGLCSEKLPEAGAGIDDDDEEEEVVVRTPCACCCCWCCCCCCGVGIPMAIGLNPFCRVRVDGGKALNPLNPPNAPRPPPGGLNEDVDRVRDDDDDSDDDSEREGWVL